MILRIDFGPMPSDLKAWNDQSLERGSISQTLSVISGESLLDVQIDAMRDAAAASRDIDQRTPQHMTLELSHAVAAVGHNTEITVLWRLVPYAASNAMSPRGETAEVQTEVRTDG